MLTSLQDTRIYVFQLLDTIAVESDEQIVWFRDLVITVTLRIVVTVFIGTWM